MAYRVALAIFGIGTVGMVYSIWYPDPVVAITAVGPWVASMLYISDHHRRSKGPF